MTPEEAAATLAPFELSGDHELERRGSEWWWFYYEPGASEPHEGVGTLDDAVANIKRCYETDPGSGFFHTPRVTIGLDALGRIVL